MNFEFFIARRLIAAKDYKSSISAPIMKIAITAIALGIIMMLISIATSLGLQRKIQEKISAFNGDIIISNQDTNFSGESQIPISINQDFYPSFPNIEGIKHIQATASKGGVIRTATEFEGVVIKGVGADYNWQYFEEYLVDGRIPDFTGNINDEVLLSSYLATRLQLKVGDKMPTYFLNESSIEKPRSIGFTIVGLYNSGFQQFDAQFALADIKQIQRINKWDSDQVGNFEVFVEDFKQVTPINNLIYAETGSELDTLSIRDKFASIFEWTDLFDFNTYLIIGIMILVAGINMITALLVLILDRTQMIGVLKALGSDDKSLRKVFIYNAMYLIGIGLFWGNIIGLGLLLIQKYFKVIKLPQETYYVTEAPIYLDVSYIILLNVGTFFLCVLMLLGPTYIIAKISPVKAMRFD